MGRGTAVYRVKHGGEERALKISYPFASRTSEHVFVAKARSALSSRSNNLPNIHYYCRGSHVRPGFAERFGSMASDKYDNRVLRVLVSDLLIPLYEIKDLTTYLRCYKEIVEGVFVSPVDGQ